MAQRFDHCRLIGSQITYLGRDGLFESRRDMSWNEFSAWDLLEKEGWELVTVIVNEDGHEVAYFKRPAQTNH
jgi:hypothetical protein